LKNKNQEGPLEWDEYVRKYIHPADARPNILLLMTDQQRFDTLGAAGYSHVKTPNLDRLIREGTYFPKAYSPNPVCMPARHNILTGLPAKYHGISGNDFHKIIPRELPVMPQLLSDNGYETRAIGKMHFRPIRRHHGFNNMELMEEVPLFIEQDEYATWLKEQGYGHIHNLHGVRNLLYMAPQRALMPEACHGTSWVADRTVDFIKTNGGRHPFFLWSSWISPHPPFNLPDAYADLYANQDLPGPIPSKTPVTPFAEELKGTGDLPGEQYVRRMRELYYAAITHVDHHIGRVLQALEETRLLDQTLILFFSDHGELLGDYGTYSKMLPYDCSSRIPFIARYPNHFQPGTVDDRFIDLNDILPTVLEAAEIPYSSREESLPGESLFQNPGKKDRSVQYMEYGERERRWISLANKDFKYNYYYAGGYEELFDKNSDLNEQTNLLYGSGAKQFKEIKQKLRTRLIEYEKKWGLEGYVQKGELVTFQPFAPQPKRNRAFPLFPDKITDPKEKKAITPFLDEVIEAVKKEPTVRFSDLDLQSFKKNGNFSDLDLQELLNRDKKMEEKEPG